VRVPIWPTLDDHREDSHVRGGPTQRRTVVGPRDRSATGADLAVVGWVVDVTCGREGSPLWIRHCCSVGTSRVAIVVRVQDGCYDCRPCLLDAWQCDGADERHQTCEDDKGQPRSGRRPEGAAV